MAIGVAVLFASFVFLTSAFSGVFGMAGGLILLWVLMAIFPPATAIAVQGFIQLTSNASRAWMTRQFLDLAISLPVIVGLVISAAIFLWISYTPNLAVISISIGLLPILVWIPRSWFTFDASRPLQGLLCGLLAGSLNVGIGTSGPIIDVFFIRTLRDRRTVIATKAFLQALSHVIKIAFYWHSALVLSPDEWVAVAIAAPFAIAGTSVGNLILHRLTDIGFRRWTRILVTLIGGVYLARGISLLT